MDGQQLRAPRDDDSDHDEEMPDAGVAPPQQRVPNNNHNNNARPAPNNNNNNHNAHPAPVPAQQRPPRQARERAQENMALHATRNNSRRT